MNAHPSELLNALVTSLDLDAYDDVQTGVLTLVDPRTGAKTTSTITLASADHPARKQIDMAKSRRLRQAMASTGKLQVTDPLEEYDEETDYMVAATLEWNLSVSGAPLVLSRDTARALYTNPKKQWVRRQVREALNKQELFIVSSAKT